MVQFLSEVSRYSAATLRLPKASAFPDVRGMVISRSMATPTVYRTGNGIKANTHRTINIPSRLLCRRFFYFCKNISFSLCITHIPSKLLIVFLAQTHVLLFNRILHKPFYLFCIVFKIKNVYRWKHRWRKLHCL